MGPMRSNHTLVVVLLLVLLLAEGLVVLCPQPVQATGREIYVDDNFHYPRDGTAEHPYRLINDALTLAQDGDTIYVYGGTYNESLVVTKRVSIIGSIDDGVTYIDKKAEHDYTIDMAANFSGLENITVQDPERLVTGYNGALIRVSASNVVVQKTTCRNATCLGLLIQDHGDNTIVGNTLNMTGGVAIQSSNNNVVSSNFIRNTTGTALGIVNSNKNIVYDNTIENCSYGIYARTTQSNNITQNYIENANINAIYLYQDLDSLLYNNTVSAYSGGGLSLGSTNSRVLENHFTHNQYGISVSSSNNLIQNNTVNSSASTGIIADAWSRNNIIEKNHLANNSPNARDLGSNSWDANGSGNYWSDYRNIDRDHDGVGDIAYSFSGGRDHYPLGVFLSAPQKPGEPYPVDDQENVGLKVTLGVTVNDSDSPYLTVYFYNALTKEKIGTARYVPANSNATCSHTLPFDTTFAWYAVANDSLQENQSDIFFFTTRQRPPLNKKPVVNAGGPYKVRIGQEFTLDGSHSYDPDTNSSLLFYRWNFGDGTSEILAENPMHNYTSPGVYTVVLTVVDRDGRSNQTRTQVTVTGNLSDDIPPVPIITEPTGLRTNQLGTFNAAASYDPDGTIVAYRWDYNGDGIYETNWTSSATGSYMYPQAGSYLIRLQVRDDTGSVNTTMTSMQVAAPPKKTPGFEAVGVLVALVVTVVLLRKRQGV